MIKDIKVHNEGVRPSDRMTEKLHVDFPQCFTNEGKFDLEKFKTLLQDNVDLTEEGYGLNFLGKNYANLIASTETETVIQPDDEHNSLPENKNSENIYISGDNLDALKHLLKSYSGKIKCIYIDPPYNTGSDGFVYNDKFNFTVEQIQDKLSISEEKAKRILDLCKRGSASHSAWLMFMAPRLMLARDLLTEDGVIFISIDDNEQANLKLLCDSVFGEENFVANISCHTNPGGDKGDFIESTLQYMLVYGKLKIKMKDLGTNLPTDIKKYPLKDEFGHYKLGSQLEKWGNDDTPHTHPNLAYSIYYNPTTNDVKHLFDYNQKEINENRQLNIIYQKPDDFLIHNGYICIRPRTTNTGENGRWRLEPQTFYERLKTQSFIFQKKKDGYKIYEKERYKEGKFLKAKDFIPSEIAKQNSEEILNLFSKKVFDYPKPISLIKYIINIYQNSDIVLDFFSGSATTAHAVMKLNIEDGGKRKYIMVQLPEPIAKDKDAYTAGYRTIDEIGQERIRRAAKKLKEENPDYQGDLGFKHYTLREVSQNTLDKMVTFNPQWISGDKSILDSFGKNTVLETWLVKDGYGLGANVEELKLGGYQAYHHNSHLYLIEGENFDEKAIIALVDKYVQDCAFNPQNVVLFGYSFTYSQTEMIKKNLATLKDSAKNLSINIDIRY